MVAASWEAARTKRSRSWDLCGRIPTFCADESGPGSTRWPRFPASTVAGLPPLAIASAAIRSWSSRTGAPVACVVSFHGLLETKRPAVAGVAKAKILACTGSADPIVPREQVTTFEKEMMEAGADWQVITYGGAKHAFTNIAADAIPMPGFGYSATADARSWVAMRNLFDEVFANR
jgi:hypothetical protein